jgi:PAS domain S-box-containing protein
MDFALFAFDSPKTLMFPAGIMGAVLVVAYLSSAGMLFYDRRHDWQRWHLARWFGLLVALAAGFLASGLFLVSLPGPQTLPLPNLPDTPNVPAIPVLGAVTALLTGTWMGVGPAILVGGAAGLGHALAVTGRGAQLLEVALAAGMVAFLLRQDYRGAAFSWLRRPVLAGIVGGASASLLAFPFLLTSSGPNTPFLSAVDFAWSHTRAAVLPNLLEWGLAGLLVEAVFVLSPELRRRPIRLISPPYEHSLTRRFLYALVPCFLLTIIVLLAAVTHIATDSATDLTLKQMSHDARVASDAVPDLNLISTNLLVQFAKNEILLQGELEEGQLVAAQFFTLERMLRTTAYFRQLVVFDRAGAIVQQYPQDSIPLLEEERRIALQAAIEGVPDTTRVWSAEYGVPVLSHAVPITDQSGDTIGALLGRVDLQIALSSTVRDLQGTVGAGRGFIVDDHGNIIAHSNADRLMQPWRPRDGEVRDLGDRLDAADIGQGYEGIGYNGTRQLVYYREGPDHPWVIVIIVPYERVLSLATEVAVPLAVFLSVGGLILTVVLAVLIGRLNQPLAALARAAGAMAHRDLETPVQVRGEDEVGRLGEAFEHMRHVLRDRLSELQLLLKVSQGVAASLDLAQGLPPILDGALEATGADGVRIVAALRAEDSAVTFARGSLSAAMAPLDGAIVRMVQHEARLRLDNLARSRIFPGLDQLADRLGAILALPLSTSQGYQGALWLAYRDPHAFTDSELGFMATLAGQASVLIENAQLFEAAEGGRRRLAAILASTSDAVIVTDREDRILLLNPAAEADFELSASQTMGQPVSDVFSDAGLVSLLTSDGDQDGTREVELPGGRVLYASASTISGEDGHAGGRVAVLRDITYFRKLDEMKTEFVNTVSHDLRSPLTYMRGYVTMLPMIGELSSKQKDYVDKILSGIDQMAKLTQDLLSLARIESDVDQLVQLVQIGGVVKGVVRSYQTHAASKGLSLEVDIADGLPEVMGDPTLLRQAIANLVDNAIKYTPSGKVGVRAYLKENQVAVQVQDTGPGISQADQVRLFERFYRVKRRDSMGIKGTGLGLAIVKSIVERRHGGRVWVESKLGAGSSFIVVLPVERSPSVGGGGA